MHLLSIRRLPKLRGHSVDEFFDSLLQTFKYFVKCVRCFFRLLSLILKTVEYPVRPIQLIEYALRPLLEFIDASRCLFFRVI